MGWNEFRELAGGMEAGAGHDVGLGTHGGDAAVLQSEVRPRCGL